jgi:hypothetical protein
VQHFAPGKAKRMLQIPGAAATCSLNELDLQALKLFLHAGRNLARAVTLKQLQTNT